VEVRGEGGAEREVEAEEEAAGKTRRTGEGARGGRELPCREGKQSRGSVVRHASSEDEGAPSSDPCPSPAPTVAAVAACRAVAAESTDPAASVAPALTSWREGKAKAAAAEAGEVSVREGNPESAAAPELVRVPETMSTTGLEGTPELVDVPSCRCLPPWEHRSSAPQLAGDPVP